MNTPPTEKNEFPQELSQFVYSEGISHFQEILSKKIVPLKKCQHSLGSVEGCVLNYEATSKTGKLEIEGTEISFHYEGEAMEALLPQKKYFFLFWPTVEEVPKKKQKLSCLKVAVVKEKTFLPPNSVVVLGRVEKMAETYFVVMTYSAKEEKPFYTVITGKYPKKKGVGDFVQVLGKFSIKTQMIEMESLQRLQLVPEEKINDLLKEQDAKKKEKKREKKKLSRIRKKAKKEEKDQNGSIELPLDKS